MPRILDVGNCDADHGRIRTFLIAHFDCAVDRVMFVEEALQAIARESYALVLVNRLIFADASPGLPLVREIQSLPPDRRPAVMLVSNFADAQREAVSAGALPGFGKAAIGADSAIECLARVLPRRATDTARS